MESGKTVLSVQHIYEILNWSPGKTITYPIPHLTKS